MENSKNLDEVMKKLNTQNAPVCVTHENELDLFDVLESIEASLRMIALYHERLGIEKGLFTTDEIDEKFGAEE